MTNENVPPVDPIEELTPVEPVIPEEGDEDDEGDLPPAPLNETPEQMTARIADLTTRNEKLWNRLQREKNSKSKQTVPAAPVAPVASVVANPALSREEAILIAKGYSVEEVEHAQKVATLQSKPLLDAVTDDLFTGWKAKRDKDAKDTAAQLPTSRGARTTTKKTFGTPGLADDEHKQMFNERIAR